MFVYLVLILCTLMATHLYGRQVANAPGKDLLEVVAEQRGPREVQDRVAAPQPLQLELPQLLALARGEVRVLLAENRQGVRVRARVLPYPMPISNPTFLSRLVRSTAILPMNPTAFFAPGRNIPRASGVGGCVCERITRRHLQKTQRHRGNPYIYFAQALLAD